MTWNRIARGMLALFAIAAFGVLAACGDDDGGKSGGVTKVTLMLDWTPNTNHAGIFIAKDKGWYRDAGLDIDIIEPSQAGVEQAVASGAAQFGISVQESVIPARGQGIPIVSVAAILQHNTSSLLSLKSDGINRPKDLAGKTYGAFGGAIEEPLIKKLVQCDGGDPNTVKFVQVGNTDYLVGLEQDQYDFVWVFDGWDGIRAKDIAKKPVSTLPFIDYVKCIPDWYTPVIITSEKMTKEQKDTVRKFVEATARGYEEAMKDPKASTEALMKAAPESDRTLVELSAQYLASRYVDKGRQWGLQDEAIWARFETFLRDSKIIDKPVNVKAAFSNEFLPKK